ncbi:MAG TPA: LON peptidase substrate-binding domain-containing protein, partial [Actinomycetota bacterium]|nr:LON peptidase substrate-binding domain-containing protein [Actinomycetota bacterium]
MPEQLDTKILPLLPLQTGVVLPHMVVTLTLESPEARAAVDAARSAQDTLLLVPRTQGGGYARVGTEAVIEEMGRTPGGAEAVVIRGLHRAVIGSGVAGTGEAIWVQVEPRPDPESVTERTEQLAREYRATLENIVEARGVPQVAEFLRGVEEPGALADMAGYSPDLTFDQKVQVLETLDVEQRLERVLAWAKEALAEAALKDKIRSEAAEGMQRNQREYILRQQLDAIRKELGEDSEENVAEEYRKKIEAAGMPEAVLAQAKQELARLERTSPQNPEHGWIRTYLDWLVDVPWSNRTEDNFDIDGAR